MADCKRHANFLMTRCNKYFCQSDFICTSHARLWLQIKKIVENGDRQNNFN
jgi:hypothetical protein